MNDNRIIRHQILAEPLETKWVKITVDGKKIEAREGETIAAAINYCKYKSFSLHIKKKRV